MSAPKTIPLSALSRGDLEALAERLLAENAALQQAIAELRAEVAQLKGVKGRPKLKPSGMEKGTEPERPGKGKQRGARSGKTVLAGHHQPLRSMPPASMGAVPVLHGPQPVQPADRRGAGPRRLGRATHERAAAPRAGGQGPGDAGR
jgi:hypothetical protein